MSDDSVERPAGGSGIDTAGRPGGGGGSHEAGGAATGEAAETEVRPGAPPSTRPSPGEWRRALVYCLAVFAATRALLAVLALAAVALLPSVPAGGVDVPGVGRMPGPVHVPGWPAHRITAGWQNVATVWERFDALWYLRIAEEGYRAGDGSAAFFPLFPLAVRAVSFVLGGHPLAAGLLVANAAFLGALVVLYALTREELSEEAARAAVVFASVFPTTFFFAAPYGESLFLLLVLVALRGARRGRWEVAGMAGALAALTRSVGLVLVLPLAVEAFHQAVSTRPGRWTPRWLWALAPAAGTGAYLLWWELRAGDWLAPLHQQSGWQRAAMAPWAAVLGGAREAVRFVGLYPAGYHLLDLLIAVAVLAAAAYAAARFRPLYGVYVWASILPPLLLVFAPRPFMSFPRFALPLFPLYWALALWTEGRRTLRELAIAASAVLLGVLFLLFAAWYYVF